MGLAVLGLHESSLKQTVAQVFVWIEPSRLLYLLASLSILLKIIFRPSSMVDSEATTGRRRIARP
jgi:hypothetical protein